MKKILLLFFSAALSFLALAYVDEYDNLIAPLLGGGDNGYTELFDPAEDKARMRDFFVYFNNSLSEAYRASDPSKVSELPLNDDLKMEITKDILSLKKDGTILDMVVRDLKVLEIKKSSQSVIKVHTLEKVAVRHLSIDDSQKSRPYSETENDLTYIMTIGPKGFELSSYNINYVKPVGNSL